VKSFTSKPLELPDDREEISRADIVFYGVDHSGLSYEARVFLDNPRADADTPRSLDDGYAGSYSVFGHAGCYGDEGHCDAGQRFRDEFDRRPPHPLTPFTKTVIVTDALKRTTGETVTITVVPVVRELGKGSPSDGAPCESVRLLAYQD
jgi:hypothetical protein